MNGNSLAVMAWRNLWRNRRRTILTLSSIVFGVLLAVLFTAMQDQNWADTIDLAARLSGGHVTLEHREYLDAPKLTLTVEDTEALMVLAERETYVERTVERISGQVMLNTAGDSFGAGFVAIDPSNEDEDTLSLPGRTRGRRNVRDGERSRHHSRRAPCGEPRRRTGQAGRLHDDQYRRRDRGGSRARFRHDPDRRARRRSRALSSSDRYRARASRLRPQRGDPGGGLHRRSAPERPSSQKAFSPRSAPMSPRSRGTGRSPSSPRSSQ